MRIISLKHSVIILIIILGLSISIKKTCERFYLGCEESCIYYNDCKIISETDSCTYLFNQGDNELGNTDINFKFSGVDTIWSINSKEVVEIIIKYNSIIENGKFKVVIIDPNEKINKILENSDEGEVAYQIQPGKTRVKIVGNKVSGSLKLEICNNKAGDCIDIFSNSI